MTDVKMKTTMAVAPQFSSDPRGADSIYLAFVLFVAERQTEDHEPDQPALFDRNQNSQQLSSVRIPRSRNKKCKSTS